VNVLIVVLIIATPKKEHAVTYNPEGQIVTNLLQTFTNEDNWGDKDLERLLTDLRHYVNNLAESIECGYDRDTILSEIGRCLRHIEGICICHKSHLMETVMLDREYNC